MTIAACPPGTLKRFDVETIRTAASGRWADILGRLGVDVPSNPKLHGPCPACGGKDRFRFDDQDGKGTWFCNQCEPKAGDGFALVQNVRRCTFHEALELVANAAGIHPLNDASGRSILRTYDYVDAAGALLFQVVRYEPKDFRQRRPDGKGGWLWGLNGLDPVLYRLPEVFHAGHVLVVEGEKDVETAYGLGLPDGWAATCNPMGAGKWRSPYTAALAGKEVMILPDADQPGAKHGDLIAQSLSGVARSISRVRLPEPFKDLSQWAEDHADLETLLMSAEPYFAVPSVTAGDVESLPIVIPLDEVTLPDFPVEAFPQSLKEMVGAVANATETPVELAALLGMATVAASCQRVFEVEMDPGYQEPLCLWSIVALQSGNRKTAVHAQMTAPLRQKERELCEAAKAQQLTIQSELDTIEARIKSLRSRCANSEDSEDIERLKREIVQMETTKPTLPSIPSLWAQDITPEKLGMLMADSGERIALLSDEGGIFDILAGRYSNGTPNLDVFLQGHSCSPVKVNRGSRAELYLHRPTLTFGLSPQPSVLRDLTNKSVLRDRGFLARVLFALPPSRLGFRTLASSPVPPAIDTAYHRMIHALLSFKAPISEDGIAVAYRLRPSREAHHEWREFARSVEQHLRPGGRYEHMSDWAGKLPGAAVRVAGNFHCVEHAQGQPHGVPISLATMKQALDVMAVLSEHALAAFDLMGADPAVDGARRVWRWVKQGHRSEFSGRDCFQDLRGTFHRMENLAPCFEVLCERGYLLKADDTKQGPGRKTHIYVVHPTLTKEWL